MDYYCTIKSQTVRFQENTHCFLSAGDISRKWDGYPLCGIHGLKCALDSIFFRKGGAHGA